MYYVICNIGIIGIIVRPLSPPRRSFPYGGDLLHCLHCVLFVLCVLFPTLDPKNFPNWAGINSILAGFKFLWAGFFWARIWSLGQTSDLKNDRIRPFHTSKMTRMSHFGWFFAHFCPWMTQLTNFFVTNFQLSGNFQHHTFQSVDWQRR